MKLDIVIPVYNEERDLPPSIHTLHHFLSEHLPHTWRIVIADNGSTDGTLSLAQSLSRELPGVDYFHLDQKGRGRALRHACLTCTADVLCYMDVDLSTDLAALPQLMAAIEAGADIAIGSRLLPGSRTTRSLKREVFSRGYNILIRVFFPMVTFRDAQCGFKAMNRKVMEQVVPFIENRGWFFDTEMLILAQRLGLRIKEIPVTWKDDPDSRVNVWKTAWEDLKGLWRLRFGASRHLPPPLSGKTR